MVIKVYVSGISGNKEVKKRQQRVLLILDSKKLKYEVIDIAEPGAEEAKDFMQNNATGNGSTISDANPRHPLPPQIFNDEVYCGDYNMFDLANEEDGMEEFLKLGPSGSTTNNIVTNENKLENGDISVNEKLPEEPQNTEPNADEAKGQADAEQELKEDESLKTEETSVEEEKPLQENEADNEHVGDAAAENGKEEETIREPSPEKAEE